MSPKPKRPTRVVRAASVVLLATCSTVGAQRASENATLEADDAFGTSVGDEDVGLYSSVDVRGFSPTRAGNVRIDGMYFDQVWGLTSRVRRSTAIRIGISAQGMPFPAPTGVVDYSLRKPGDANTLSATLAANSFAGGSLEFDGTRSLLPGVLSVGGGVGLYNNEFGNGTNSRQHIEGLLVRWTPSPAIEVLPFWARSTIADDEIGPVYVPAGSYLPPRAERRRYRAPQWIEYAGIGENIGVVSRFDLGPGWQLRAGAFRSLFDNSTDHFVLFDELTADGRGDYLVLADPPNLLSSDSGELHLTRTAVAGPRQHQFHFSLRARDRRSRNGGTDVISLGEFGIDDRIDAPEPTRAFGEQTRDRVQQTTLGVGYDLRWREIGELSAGVQKTDYRKRFDQPGIALAQTDSAPWLYNVAAAGHLSERLAVYAGYTRGLEESGVAPPNAANRNDALPAIITSQRDAGVRWTISPTLKLIAGVFDVRKPYFNLDGDNRFAGLGNIENKGVEASLSGELREGLSVVVGAVLSRPRVTGEGVSLGRLGERPVDQPDRRVELSVDYQPSGFEGLSLSASVSHVGRVATTTDNQVELPSRSLLDLGARYAFDWSGRSASARLGISNVLDTYAFEVSGAGAYTFIDGRQVSLRLIVDF